MKPIQCFRILQVSIDDFAYQNIDVACNLIEAPFRIQVCIDDFAYQNIEVACNLFEACGRFLYRNKV
ncbi:hypothetical protein T484DRAFT_1787016 [Baffinella frigidus]|nr:hypothetical protein T484DRAFT_1787016 [Cryptophyta sp. CCMP2293]